MSIAGGNMYEFVSKTWNPNANCIGCVKASGIDYWNLVRREFPEIFEQRAEMSRRIGARLTLQALAHFELLVIQGTLYGIIVLFGKILTGYL